VAQDRVQRLLPSARLAQHTVKRETGPLADPRERARLLVPLVLLVLLVLLLMVHRHRRRMRRRHRLSLLRLLSPPPLVEVRSHLLAHLHDYLLQLRLHLRLHLCLHLENLRLHLGLQLPLHLERLRLHLRLQLHRVRRACARGRRILRRASPQRLGRLLPRG